MVLAGSVSWITIRGCVVGVVVSEEKEGLGAGMDGD